MRGYPIWPTGVDAGRSTPHFDNVLVGSQILRSPNGSMVTDMGAGINIRRFDALTADADFVSVHGKLISNRQIPKSHVGIAGLR